MRERGSEPDAETERAFEVLIEQARLRLEMPRLMARVLDVDPPLVHRALRDWAAQERPLSDIYRELRRAAGDE